MRLALGRRDDAASASLGVVFKQDPHRAGTCVRRARREKRSGWRPAGWQSPPLEIDDMAGRIQNQ